MARLSTAGASTPETAAINLTRLLSRLQKTLLRPDSVTEQRLRSSSYERIKVGTNLDYAKTLLLRLEQDTVNIKIQSRKQEAQAELLQKRDVIRALDERLEEFEASGSNTEEDSSDGEDLLGDDTPSDDVDETGTPAESQILEDLIESAEAPEVEQPIPPLNERDELFPTSLRSRHAQSSSQPIDTGHTSSSSTNPTNVTATTEALLTHNRTEQESLTDSLLSMAQALKSSSQAFASSLESEKDILGRTGEGLEKNKSGLDAAQKRMGYLRKMSEGKGLWGRMMMYAWIFGLMLIALFIVGFLPKLRF